jgi:hypothetical protein
LAAYSLRVLSALGLLFLVAGSYFLCARVFSERRVLRLGVPLLLACFPQDFFFSVSPDAWAPALGMGGLALLCRWRFATPAERSWGLSVSLGLAMAALFLTKFSNLPVVLVALFVVGRQAFRGRDERSALLHAVAVALVAALPVALWLGRNLAVFGTLTGTAGKIEALTWTPRARYFIGRGPRWPYHSGCSTRSHWPSTSARRVFLGRSSLLHFGKADCGGALCLCALARRRNRLLVCTWRKRMGDARRRGIARGAGARR